MRWWEGADSYKVNFVLCALNLLCAYYSYVDKRWLPVVTNALSVIFFFGWGVYRYIELRKFKKEFPDPDEDLQD